MDSRAHYATTIVTRKVVGRHLGHRTPVARREVRQEAVADLAGHIVQPRCLPVQLIEPGERGVEVGLVEDLDAAVEIAVGYANDDCPPFGIKALLRSAACGVGHDRSQLIQPMHRFDVDSDVWREVPQGGKIARQILPLGC